MIRTTTINPKRVTLDENKVKASLRRDMRTFLIRCQRDLRTYPPQKPPIKERRIEETTISAGEGFPERTFRRNKGLNKPYKRTYDLRSGWKYSVSGDGFTGNLYNDVEYAVYVQGPKRYGQSYETGLHQRQLMRSKGWRSVSDVARARRREFTTLCNRAIRGGEAVFD